VEDRHDRSVFEGFSEWHRDVGNGVTLYGLVGGTGPMASPMRMSARPDSRPICPDQLGVPGDGHECERWRLASAQSMLRIDPPSVSL